TRPDFWNSGFFADTPGKMGLLAVYTGTVFILSLPLSLIYILSVIIKRLSVR
ncbi:colicin transporter, partial [Salmonella enterica]|nr:colicin transporter [Salmonella enterica subsp. enterica serovar Kentucky]ECX4064121.1 colicin transporter [Salmonella enterica subsp. enterica serovar Kentucky]EDS6705780.1 colicin transporter [Salmonella enterica subsp. enterica serovar Kentucky]